MTGLPAVPLPALPLPVLSAALCVALAGLILRLDLGTPRASRLFAALFTLFALQSALVALRFGYGVTTLAPVQALLPLLNGPLVWLGFASLSAPQDRFPRLAGLHLGAAVGLAGLAWALSLQDAAIIASFLGYAAMLGVAARRGPDALVLARLDVAALLPSWMVWAALLLVVQAATDAWIATSFALGRPAQATAIIAGASLLFLPVLVLLFFALAPHLGQRPTSPEPRPDADAAVIEARARALITDQRLYLDPDLTLQRLARRLHVPTRALSQAINATQGLTLSQYINRFRLDHAAALLRDTDGSVAEVMAQSGFLTRSNFYREFQRAHGVAPAAWRAQARQDQP